MYRHEFAREMQSPRVSTDIDSALGSADSFEAFRSPLSFIPYSPLTLTGKSHGILLEIQDPNTEYGYQLVAPELIPNIQGFKFSTWDKMEIYLLFPKKYLQRQARRDDTVQISHEDKRQLYDKVLLPAFKASIDPSTSNSLPMSWDLAKSQATARSEQGANHRGGSHSSLLSHIIQPQEFGEFDRLVRQNIRENGLVDFEDMIIWFVARGFKNHFRCNSYHELKKKWIKYWKKHFDDRFAPPNKHWWDIGRQFCSGSPSDSIEENQAWLWKPCCIRRYWRARTKKFNLQSFLPLHRYHMAGMNDVVSATMTAKAGGPFSEAGAPYSQFYSTGKNDFITATVEVFQNHNIEVLVHGQSHLQTVASAGRARVPTIAEAVRSFISSTKHSALAVDAIHRHALEAREEHRLRGDVARSALTRLADIEAGNSSATANLHMDDHVSVEPPGAQHTVLMTTYERKLRTLTQELRRQGRSPIPMNHMPFWIPLCRDLAGFLRGNLNNALMGFHMVLRQVDDPFVSQAVTATGLLYLQHLRFCLLSKNLRLAPQLYRDEWPYKPGREFEDADILDSSSGDERPQSLINKGLGMAKNMKEFGFAYPNPGIMDYTKWRISKEHVGNFFRNEPAFAQAMIKRRQQVLHFSESQKVVELLQQWLNDTRTLAPAHTEAILDFASGFLMTSYRHSVWAHLKGTKVLDHLPEEKKKELLSGCVPITYSNIRDWVRDRDPLVSSEPWIRSSSATYHEGDPMYILDYMFGVHTPWTPPNGKKGSKNRKSWVDKPFRTLFALILRVLEDNLSQATVRQWQDDFYCIVHATNPLLPSPEGTTFLGRTHGHRGYIWLAFQWPHCDLGSFTQEVSCRNLVRGVYPYGAYPHGAKATTWSYRNGGDFFDGTPPKLIYEKEFLGKSLEKIDRRMRRKWARFRLP